MAVRRLRKSILVRLGTSPLAFSDTHKAKVKLALRIMGGSPIIGHPPSSSPIDGGKEMELSPTQLHDSYAPSVLKQDADFDLANAVIEPGRSGVMKPSPLSLATVMSCNLTMLFCEPDPVARAHAFDELWHPNAVIYQHGEEAQSLQDADRLPRRLRGGERPKPVIQISCREHLLRTEAADGSLRRRPSGRRSRASHVSSEVRSLKPAV